MDCLGLHCFAGAFQVEAVSYNCDYAHFSLWNADDNILYTENFPSYYYNSACSQDWEFSIQADPGYGCYDYVKSAKIVMSGPADSVSSDKKENVAPYMVFGDRDATGFKYDPNYPGYYEGNIIGRDWVAGVYNIEAYFYSKGNLGGELVTSISGYFYVYDNCCYGYYHDPEKATGDGGRRLLLGSKLEK